MKVTGVSGTFLLLAPLLGNHGSWVATGCGICLSESVVKVSSAYHSELLSWALPEQEMTVCCVNPLRLGTTLLWRLALFYT